MTDIPWLPLTLFIIELLIWQEFVVYLNDTG